MDDLSAGIGHNSGLPYDPDIADALERRVRDLADAGGVWLDLGRVEDDAQAGKLSDFITQTRKCEKEIEDARKAAKKPHDDAAKVVDSKFKTLTAPLGALSAKLKQILSEFATEKQRRLDEQKRLEREEARRAQDEADRLRREAEARNDVIGQAAAEEAAKDAARAVKAAEKPARAQIASTTGGGRTMSQRVSYRAQIEGDSNARRAFSFLLADEASALALIAEMERLCTAARRRQGGPAEIPGVNFIEERSVA